MTKTELEVGEWALHWENMVIDIKRKRWNHGR
jgi:hypothetical protein